MLPLFVTTLPSSSEPTHFEAIELVNAKAAPRKSSNGGTVKCIIILFVAIEHRYYRQNIVYTLIYFLKYLVSSLYNYNNSKLKENYRYFENTNLRLLAIL